MSKIAGKNKSKKQKKIVNGGHVKNIPLYIENVILLKKLIFNAEVKQVEQNLGIKTPFQVSENFEIPKSENLSERKVLDWIYQTGDFDKIDVQKNPRVLFKNFETHMIAIKPESAERFNDAYIAHLESNGVHPYTEKGLKNRAPGCLTMSELHNLFLHDYLRQKLELI